MKRFYYFLYLMLPLWMVSETIKAEEWRISNTGNTKVVPGDFPSSISGCGNEQVFTMHLYRPSMFGGGGGLANMDYDITVDLENLTPGLSDRQINEKIRISLSIHGTDWTTLEFSTKNGVATDFLEDFIKGLKRDRYQVFYMKFESIGSGMSAAVKVTATRSRESSIDNSYSTKSGTIVFDNITNATAISLKSESEVNIGEKAVTFNVKNSCYALTWGTPYLRIVSATDPRNSLAVSGSEFTQISQNEYIVDIPLLESNVASGSDAQVTLKAKSNAPDGTFNFTYYVVGGQNKDRWSTGSFNQVVHVLEKAKLTMPRALPDTISDCMERDYSIKASSPFYNGVTAGALEIISSIVPDNVFSLVNGQDTILFTNQKAYINLPFGNDGTSTINLSVIPLVAKSDNDITLTYRVVESKSDLTQWGSGLLSHTFGLFTSKSTTLSLANGADNDIIIGEKTVPVIAGNPCYNNGWGIPYLRIISTENPNNYISINGYQFSPGSPETYYLDIPLSGGSVKNLIAEDLEIIAKPNDSDTSFVFTYYVFGGNSGNMVRWGNDSIIQKVNILEKVKFITQPEDITPDTLIACGGYDYSVQISSPFHHDVTVGALEITSNIDPAGIFSLVNGQDTIIFTNRKAYIDLQFDGDSTSTVDLNIVPLIAKSNDDITLSYRVVESKNDLTSWSDETLSHTFGLHASESTMLSFASGEDHDIAVGEDSVYVHVGNTCYNNRWGSAYLRIVSQENSNGYLTINDRQFNQGSSGHYFLDIPLSGDSIRNTIAKGLEICAESDAPDTTFTFTYYVFGGKDKIVRWESDSVIQNVSILEKAEFITQPEDIIPDTAVNCEGYNYTLNISSSVVKGVTAGALEITSNIAPGTVFSLINGQTPVSFDQLKAYIPLTFDNHGNASVNLNIQALSAARGENVTLTYRVVESESNPEQWGTGSLDHSLTMNALQGTYLTLKNLDALLVQFISSNGVVGCDGIVLDLLVNGNDCQAGLDGYILFDIDFNSNHTAGYLLSGCVSIESANGSVIDFVGNTDTIKLDFEMDADGKFRDQITIKPLHQAVNFSTIDISGCKVYTDADELLTDATGQMGIVPEITLDPAGLRGTPAATTLSAGMNAQETFAASVSRTFTADINTTECMTGASAAVIFELSDPNDSTRINMYLDDGTELDFVNGEARYTFIAGTTNTFTYNVECFAGSDEAVQIPMACSLYYNGIECVNSNHLLVINEEQSYLNMISQPQGASICEGSDYMMSIGVDGENVNYQWYKGDTKIEGATDYEYPIIDASSDDDDTYFAVVWNRADTITSNRVNVRVAEPLTEYPAFLECPGTAKTGQSYRISLKHYPDVISYKWSYSSSGADFYSISYDANMMDVIFSADALGEGILSVDVEHVCGTYTVSQKIIVERDGGTGTETIAPEAMRIYLDPVTQELIVRNERLNVTHLVVSDISGRIVYHAKPAVSSCRILVGHWPAGIYIVRATTDTGVTVRKVIKR